MTPLARIRVARTGDVAIVARQPESGSLAAGFVERLVDETSAPVRPAPRSLGL